MSSAVLPMTVIVALGPPRAAAQEARGAIHRQARNSDWV